MKHSTNWGRLWCRADLNPRNSGKLNWGDQAVCLGFGKHKMRIKSVLFVYSSYFYYKIKKKEKKTHLTFDNLVYTKVVTDTILLREAYYILWYCQERHVLRDSPLHLILDEGKADMIRPSAPLFVVICDSKLWISASITTMRCSESYSNFRDGTSVLEQALSSAAQLDKTCPSTLMLAFRSG